MNYLVTLYAPDIDSFCYHTVFADEGSVCAIAENLSRMQTMASDIFWDVHSTDFISDNYPIEAR